MPFITHPDTKQTIEVTESAAAVHRKAGWVDAEEPDTEGSSRRTRRSTPQQEDQ